MGWQEGSRVYSAIVESRVAPPSASFTLVTAFWVKLCDFELQCIYCVKNNRETTGRASHTLPASHRQRVAVGAEMKGEGVLLQRDCTLPLIFLAFL